MKKVKWYEEMSINDFIKIYPRFWFQACRYMPDDLITDLLTDPLYKVRVCPDSQDPEHGLIEFGYSEDNWDITA